MSAKPGKKLKVKTAIGDGKARAAGDTSESKQLAAGAKLNGPESVCFDAATETLYVGEGAGVCVRMMTRDGRVRLLAGTPGVKGYADGAVGVARFGWINALAIDSKAGILYVADTINHAIRAVRVAGAEIGTVKTVAGAATPGRSGCADGMGVVQAMFASPSGLAFDGATNRLFVADSSNHRIRVYDTVEGTVTTISGKGGKGYMDCTIGDAQYQSPTALAWDAANKRLYVTDCLNRRIRVLSFADDLTRTVCGDGTDGTEDGKAGVARFSVPLAIEYDAAGQRLFVGDKALIRSVSLTPGADKYGVVTTYAGQQRPTTSNRDVDGKIDKATFNTVHGLSYDAAHHRLFVADAANHKIRVVAPSKVPLYWSPFKRVKAPTPKVLLSDIKQWTKKVDEWQNAGAVDKESLLSGASIRILRIETKAKLQAKDVGGSSDPYFVWFLTDGVNASRQTDVTKTHLYPVMDFTKDTATTKLAHPLVLPLTFDHVTKLKAGQLVLYCEVWDEDPVYDDFMGCGNVPLKYAHAKNSVPAPVIAAAPRPSIIATAPDTKSADGTTAAAATAAAPVVAEAPPLNAAGYHLEEDIAIIDGTIDGGRIRVTISVDVESPAPPMPVGGRPSRTEFGEASPLSPTSAAVAAANAQAATQPSSPPAAAPSSIVVTPDTSLPAAAASSSSSSDSKSSAPSTPMNGSGALLTTSASSSGLVGTGSRKSSPQVSPRGSPRLGPSKESFSDPALAKFQAASSAAQRRSGAAGVDYDDKTIVHVVQPACAREKKRSIVTDEKLWRAKMNDAKSNLDPKAAGGADKWDGVAMLQIKRIDTLEPLLAKDVGGTSDPYFVFWLSAWNGGAIKTNVVLKSLTPTYDLSKAPLSFPLTARAQQELKDGKLVLHIECWDKDPVYDDFMGWMNVPLKHTTADKNEFDVFDIPLLDKDKAAGAVRVVLHYNFNWV